MSRTEARRFLDILFDPKAKGHKGAREVLASWMDDKMVKIGLDVEIEEEICERLVEPDAPFPEELRRNPAFEAVYETRQLLRKLGVTLDTKEGAKVSEQICCLQTSCLEARRMEFDEGRKGHYAAFEAAIQKNPEEFARALAHVAPKWGRHFILGRRRGSRKKSAEPSNDGPCEGRDEYSWVYAQCGHVPPPQPETHTRASAREGLLNLLKSELKDPESGTSRPLIERGEALRALAPYVLEAMLDEDNSFLRRFSECVLGKRPIQLDLPATLSSKLSQSPVGTDERAIPEYVRLRWFAALYWTLSQTQLMGELTDLDMPWEKAENLSKKLRSDLTPR